MFRVSLGPGETCSGAANSGSGGLHSCTRAASQTVFAASALELLKIHARCLEAKAHELAQPKHCRSNLQNWQIVSFEVEYSSIPLPWKYYYMSMNMVSNSAGRPQGQMSALREHSLVIGHNLSDQLFVGRRSILLSLGFGSLSRTCQKAKSATAHTSEPPLVSISSDAGPALQVLPAVPCAGGAVWSIRTLAACALRHIFHAAPLWLAMICLSWASSASSSICLCAMWQPGGLALRGGGRHGGRGTVQDV